MATKPTPRQLQLLSLIYKYLLNCGYPPTFEEMRSMLHVSSNQSILDLLTRLEKGRLITRSESSARGLTLKPLAYKLLDKPPLAPPPATVSAGQPISALYNPGSWMPFSADTFKLKSEVELFKVRGDSMINAGIDDGDVVLVQYATEFSSGNIVLAEVKGEFTIKRFISDDKPPFIYLKPENPAYSIIPAGHETRLRGKVLSVLKNNQWLNIN